MAYNTPYIEDAVDATITIGAENTNVRNIDIQLKDAAGNNMDAVCEFEILMFLNATPTDYVATGGSTGIAIGATGKLLTVVAKKYFRAISSATGLVQLTWTDTGTEAFCVGVRLSGGKIVYSAVVANT